MKKYKPVETEDGTTSLFSEDFNELMHTKKGAFSEALTKHIYPSGILNSTEKSINVLDVGFGTGYNILALLHEVAKQSSIEHITVYSLELDNSSLPFLKNVQIADEMKSTYNKILQAFAHGEYEEESFKIKMFFGDGRKNIVNFDNDFFHLVFQDAFSPGKNPELWSLDYFNVLYSTMKDSAVLTTYSAAPQIRRALIEAGFFIEKGPSMGFKKEGTIGRKFPDKKNNPEELKEIYDNIKSTPYRDKNLSAQRSELLEGRIEEMKILREKKKLS